MTRRWWPAIVLALASAAVSADPPRQQASLRIERTPEFVAGVESAIDKGVGWLKGVQSADGSFPDFAGYPGAVTALAYHTMRVCGVPKDDPAAVKAWDALRREYRKADLRTYSAALYLMAIETHGERLAAAKDDGDVRLSTEDARWAGEITRLLAGGQNADGAWTYTVLDVDAPRSGAAGGRADNQYDHSNTQYALLGLKCAARCRVPIDRSVWTRSLLHFLAGQEASGPETLRRGGAAASGREKGRTSAAPVDHARGWGYRSDERSVRASMTASGVSSVVICRSELMGTHEMTVKLDAESERSVWDGLAWLGTNWAVAGDRLPRRVVPNFYEYYAVERAGVLAGVEWMADLDWYGAGAAPLLATQERDGSWRGPYGSSGAGGSRGVPRSGIDPVDTCFALLFLKKGTTAVRRGAVTQVGEDSDINFAAGAQASGRDLEDFLDLVLSRWRRATDDGVKRRLLDGAAAAGPRIVEPLLVRMDAADAAERAAAHALLRHATGLDFGYDPAANAAVRDGPVVRWQSWWMGAKDRLAWDASARRIVER